jgi:recombination protein RecT
MSQNSVSSAVALRSDGASAIIDVYRDDLAAIMPSHIKPDVYMRLAVSVLARDENLMRAAQNNPASLMAALWESSRLGLMPGTEEYYLTVRKKKGVPEILGMPGYQGEVELIYRAGAVSSVIVEVVRTNDVFVWKQGSLDTERPQRWVGPQIQPYHEIDWDADPRSRGDLRLAYAYGVMKDGAISKVVVLNRKHIEEAKEFSGGGDKEWLPWLKHEESMWLKTAAHRLRKWVPTSAEYMREQLRAINDVQAERAGSATAQMPGQRVAPPVEQHTAEEFQTMADDASTVDELSAALREARLAGFAQEGDPLFAHFLARKAAIEAQGGGEPAGAGVVYEHSGHASGYDSSCEGCRAEQAAIDQQMAGA